MDHRGGSVDVITESRKIKLPGTLRLGRWALSHHVLEVLSSVSADWGR